MKEKKIEDLYIRIDLTKRDNLKEIEENGIAYYRLSKKEVDFLNLLEEERGEIVGIELERKDNGKIGFNTGFLMAKLKQ